MLLIAATDEERPNKVVTSVLPHGNQLTFFQVGRNTFHEVQEVYSPTKRRLSINGWFHTKALNDNKVRLPQSIVLKVQPFAEIDENVFRGWIAPQFIAPEMQKEIRYTFFILFLALSNARFVQRAVSMRQ